jgi:carboxylesterase
LTDLESKKWEDWYKDVENSYEFLKNKTKKVYVLGVSSGASLAIYLAGNNNPNGIILIAPPIYLNNTKAEFAFIFQYFKKYGYFGVDKTQVGHAYENLPLTTISEFVDLIKISAKSLNKIEEPVLIIQSKIDNVVQPKSTQYVFDNIRSEQKQILWVRSIKHAVIRDYEDDTNASIAERENVFNQIYDFISK